MKRERLFFFLVPHVVLALLITVHISLYARSEVVIIVDTTEDEVLANGTCSLREAIIAANNDAVMDGCPAGNGDDVIVVPGGTYFLTIADAVEENAALTGDLDLRYGVMLVGEGEGVTVVDGNGIDRVFHLPYAATRVTIADMTIRGGDLGVGTGPQYSGGGVSLISGSVLTLTQVAVEDNWASFGQVIGQSGVGGGIYNNGGTAVLHEVTVQDNKAGFAGGIYNGGNLVLVDSSVAENESAFYAGGIQSSSNPLYSDGLQMDGSTVSGNVAGTSGGGLYINEGWGDIRNSTISNNVANNYLGGGMWVYYEGAVVTVTHSTLAGNTAGTGGGIYNTHQQGLMGEETAVFLPETPHQNPNIFLKNTIVAENNGGDCAVSLTADLPLSLGYSLASDTSCSFGNPTDQNNTDPLLGPLQDNGGPTWTQALLLGSLAIDTGSCLDAHNQLVTVDQRGVARPQPVAGICDRGAFEAGLPILWVAKNGNGSGYVGSDPAGIDCGTACTAVLQMGTVMTLTASPDPLSTFTGWSGICSGMGDCIVTMTAHAVVTATFVLNQHDLNVTTNGQGSGTVSSNPAGISCPFDCVELYEAGTVVTLTASYNPATTALVWGGDCSTAAGDNCVVSMDMRREVTATFILGQYSLGVTVTGSGIVSSNPPGILCQMGSGQCMAAFDSGTVVTLTAVADTASIFTNWAGDCAGNSSCIVTMDMAHNITATFTIQQINYFIYLPIAMKPNS